jgi:hypothetical protein
MEQDHPDAPRQFGIRISNAVMGLVYEIQEFGIHTQQSPTLCRRCGRYH